MIENRGHSMSRSAIRGRAAGFTLIELMIVVAVVAILAAVTMPSYTQYIQRTHRAHARSALLQAAQWMERVATAQGQYPTALASGLENVEGGRYGVSLDGDSSSTTAFTLVATRANPGGNASDRCGDFTLTNTGAKGIENAATGMTVAECWDR